MKFGEILELMKEGKPARRKEWSDNTYIVKQINSDINKEVVPNMQSLSPEAKALIKEMGNGIHYRQQVLVIYREDRKTKATNYNPDWIDIFSEDWEVWEPKE